VRGKCDRLQAWLEEGDRVFERVGKGKMREAKLSRRESPTSLTRESAIAFDME